MWKRHLDIILEPHHTKPKTTLKHHFRHLITKPKPKSEINTKLPPKKKTKQTKKKRIVQSIFTSFLPQPAQQQRENNLPPPIIETAKIADIR